MAVRDAPHTFIVIYGGLAIGVSDEGLTLFLIPRQQLRLLSISTEDIPCIVPCS